MIEVEGVCKYYGSFLALDNISFSTPAGRVIGLVGPNGAGKTTLLRILTTFLRPTRGYVSVASYSIHSHPLEVRRSIGYLPENAPLYTELLVKEFLFLRSGLKMQGKSKKERWREIEELAEVLKIKDYLNSPIGHLSKGYRQRVGLAEALLGRPPVLILDEPTTAMDPLQKREILRWIRTLVPQHTILFSSHILSEVEQVADEVLILHQGRLLAYGCLEELAKKWEVETLLEIEVKLTEEEWKKWLSCFSARKMECSYHSPWLKAKLWFSSFQEAEKARSQLSQAKLEFRTLSLKKHTLEEVFLALVEKKT